MSFDETEIFQFPLELKKSICGDKNKKIRSLKKTTNTKINIIQNDGNVALLHITGEAKSIQKALTKLKQSTINARRQLRKESSARLLISLSNSASCQRTEGEEEELEAEEHSKTLLIPQKKEKGERNDDNQLNKSDGECNLSEFNTNDIDRFNIGENIQNDNDKNKTIGFEYSNATDYGKEGPFEIIINDYETQTPQNFYTIENISDNCCKMLENIINNDDSINNLNPVDEKTLTKGYTLEKNSMLGINDSYINTSSLEINLENDYETSVDEMEKKEENNKTTTTSSFTSNIIKILGAGLIIAGLSYYYKINLKTIQKKQK